jgi:lipopolysaccharide export system permease protein
VNRLDRYLFVTQLGPFGFFALALTGIIWLAQTLPLMEIIIDNGHSGFIFLEFAALILPNVLIIVLPIAVFASTLFSINKLFGESEMVVILSSGLSPTRIIRATVAVGVMVMLTMVVLLVVLQPRSATQLADRIAEVRQDFVASLLREKQFIHPSAGITIYIKESSKAGEIGGLFLNDQRDISNPTTYSAKQALLLQDEDELRLVMHQGIMQRYSVVEKNLNIIEFDQFVFDLSGILGETGERNATPSEYFISELLNPEEIIASGGKYSAAAYLAEAHQKMAMPLLALVLPIYAFAMLMTAGYKRTGLGVRIALTGGSGMFIVVTMLMIKTWVIANPAMYLFSYVPALLCLLLALLVLTKNRVKRTLYQLPARVV